MEVLSGVATVCKCALSLENLTITSELIETLQIIHGTKQNGNIISELNVGCPY